MNDTKKIGEKRMNTRSWAIAFTRISFGLVWAIDAYFKWQPAFADQFVSYLQETYDGQPAFIQAWLDFWIKLVSINPHLCSRALSPWARPASQSGCCWEFSATWLIPAGPSWRW